MVPTILISAYRFFFKIRFSAVTYLLNPSRRFYFMLVARFMFIFLILSVIVWLPLIIDVDRYINPNEGPMLQLFALTSVLDYFAYFLFSSAEDSSEAANMCFESDDPYLDPIDMSMAFYQTDLFDMDSDYENLEEEWEVNSRPTYFVESGKGMYVKYSSLREGFSGTSPLHIDKDTELVEKHLNLLMEDHEFNLNQLSSIERVYRSGFFDYGYDYDFVPDTFLEKKEFSLSPISEIDFDLRESDEDTVFDDIITVELNRADKEEIVIMSDMNNSILGLENVDLNFINYANEYSIDVYEDILQPNVRISQDDGEFAIDHSTSEDT